MRSSEEKPLFLGFLGSSAEALVRDYKEEKLGDKAIQLAALKYCMKA